MGEGVVPAADAADKITGTWCASASVEDARQLFVIPVTVAGRVADAAVSAFALMDALQARYNDLRGRMQPGESGGR